MMMMLPYTFFYECSVCFCDWLHDLKLGPGNTTAHATMGRAGVGHGQETTTVRLHHGLGSRWRFFFLSGS